MLEQISPEGVLLVGGLGGAIGVGSAVLLVLLMRRTKLFSSFFGRRARAEAAIAEYSAQVANVNNQRQILSPYSAEYFETFKEAGWEDFNSLVDDLLAMNHSLNFLLSERRYREVEEVCDYLMGRCDPATARKLQDDYDGLSSVDGWADKTRLSLLKLIDSVKTSAEGTQKLGIQRNRAKRKPTLLSLAELRNSVEPR
jgi:hypothetical protein